MAVNVIGTDMKMKYRAVSGESVISVTVVRQDDRRKTRRGRAVGQGEKEKIKENERERRAYIAFSGGREKHRPSSILNKSIIPESR
jgi:hypothetical protein